MMTESPITDAFGEIIWFECHLKFHAFVGKYKRVLLCHIGFHYLRRVCLLI